MRHLPSFLFVLVSIPLLAVAPGLSQQNPANHPAATFTTSSELVLVPVNVKNRSGKPLVGLTQKDFVLKSDGKVEPVAIFEEMHTSKLPAAAAAPSHLPPQPRRIFANVPRVGLPRNLIIIVIDLVNTPTLRQTWAKQRLVDYLAKNMPNQPFALVALTDKGLLQIHSFSSDPSTLAKALQKVKVALTRHEEQQIFTPGDPNMSSYGDLLGAFNEAQFDEARMEKQAAAITLAGFEQLAQVYAGVPGRKSVIWLTTGIPFLQVAPDSLLVRMRPRTHLSAALVPAYEHAFSLMNTADMTIYPVNLAGISTDASYLGDGIHTLMIPYLGIAAAAAESPDPTPAEVDDGMQRLADATGGTVCAANTTLKNCVNRAVQDASDYYLLGFYVSSKNRKPGWHKLSVNVLPAHGAVHTRTRYFLAAQSATNPKLMDALMENAVGSTMTYSGIAFGVEKQMVPAKKTSTGKPSPATTIYRIMIPATSVMEAKANGGLSFDVVTAPLAADGKIISADSQVTHIRMTPADARKVLLSGWNLVYAMPPDKSIKSLRVTIRDNTTSRIGAVTIPVNR